ncbi:ATP-binding protein [Streptomyces sp. NPDC048506]|uniref:ATP-binding protein n=1 Tax=Streptomyces sp. NPDC048506 TaxID=3155028 RepID=UPI0034438A94
MSTTLIRSTAPRLSAPARPVATADHTTPHSRQASWPLGHGPSAVPQARHLTRGQLRAWGRHAQIDDTELLVSELVTNAVRHARGPIRLTLTVRYTTLRCEVEDADPTRPRPRRTDDSDEHGRGMALLALLTRRWGSRPTDGGKAVWFELAAPSEPGNPGR